MSELIDDLVLARRMAGLSQRSVAGAIGMSRGLVAQWEQRRVVPGVAQLSRWGAVVGLQVSLRAFPGDDPLRDAGQLRVLARFRAAVGGGWSWRTEVSVTSDPRDRRAFDAVLEADGHRVAVEATTRLVDAQAQVRPIMAKLAASGIERVVLVVPDTRQNRAALAAGAATIGPAFPRDGRQALAAMRAGHPPPENAIVVL